MVQTQVSMRFVCDKKQRGMGRTLAHNLTVADADDSKEGDESLASLDALSGATRILRPRLLDIGKPGRRQCAARSM